MSHCFQLLGKMNAEPTPPEEIPTYIVEGIDRQDRETLAAIEVYAQECREHLEAVERRDLDEEDLADSDEELLEVEKSEAGTVVIKKIPCGKDCGGCPHGPYKYVVSREGDDLNWEYKGRVEQ
jgi:hypothetical protein